MNVDEAINAIKTLRKYNAETINIEAKSARGGYPNCLDTVSSFANYRGGVIIFGLSETRNFTVEGVYDVAQLQARLVEDGKNCMTAAIHMDIVAFEFEGKMLVAAKVNELPQNEKPCYITSKGMDRGSYTRVGESDERMTAYETYALRSYARNEHDDLRPIERSDLSDLNKKEVARYIEHIKSQKPNLAQFDDEKILKVSGIISKTDGMPTLAGTMVFGIYPQSYYPQLFVACTAMPGAELGEVGDDGQRFDDNARIEGTIEQMLAGTIGFLRRNMRTKVTIDDNGRRIDTPEYPITALREAVANALVHRDYSHYTEGSYVQISMFRDRIEIINPGALYGQNRVEKLGTSAMMEVRNPNIIRLLEEKEPALNGDLVRALENRHTGIATMRREMKKYGLPEPEFIEGQGAFKVIFRKVSDTVSDTVNKADKIIAYCSKPRSAAEIANMLSITRIYALRQYISPLVERGDLAMTLPDKPHSRNQKYISINAKETN